MKIKYFFLGLFVSVIALGSCKKDKYDPEKQLAVEEALIQKFIADNNIPASRHSSGVYYYITDAGSDTAIVYPTDSVLFRVNTIIDVNYTGRLLDGTIFNQTTTQPGSFYLGDVIQGWQIGVPMILKGGRIRLIIPSVYAFGRNAQNGIPANAILDFDIELLDIKN